MRTWIGEGSSSWPAGCCWRAWRNDILPRCLPHRHRRARRPRRQAARRSRAARSSCSRALRYDSGDWDFNPKVAANVLNSVVEYTTVPVYREEVVITADSDELVRVPVPLHDRATSWCASARRNATACTRYVERGGLLFSDDCNHDVAGLYAHVVRARDARRLPAAAHPLAKIPNTHPLYRALLQVPGRPAADLARAERLGRRHGARLPAKPSSIDGRVGVLYSNKDYGCEWDYDWRNKRFQRDDNTRFAINIVVYAMTA